LDANGNDIYGRMEPGAIWQDFMDAYLNGKPKETFPSYQLIGPAAPPVHHETPPQRHARQRSGDPQDDQFDTPIPDQINPPTRHHGSPQQDPCSPSGVAGRATADPATAGRATAGPATTGRASDRDVD
jgi:hypothetical protein